MFTRLMRKTSMRKRYSKAIDVRSSASPAIDDVIRTLSAPISISVAPCPCQAA